FGYAVAGTYEPTLATRSSVANAARDDSYTKAISGRSTGTCELIRTAVLRAAVDSAPVFGFANAYVAGLAIAGTATRLACSRCGDPAVEFHPTSGSIGE